MNSNGIPSKAPLPRAFTLIELLTVIAIIGILAALIIGTVSQVRQQARGARCLSQMRSWLVTLPLYAADNKGKLPQSLWDGTANGETLITLAPYAGIGNGWTNTRKLQQVQRIQCPVDEWGYGCNSFVDRMNMASLTNPASLVYMMDTHNAGRWVNGRVLTATSATTHGLQLKYAFPRPHRGKVSVGFLDGHTQLRKLSSLNYAAFTKGTSSYEATHETQLVMTDAEEAAAANAN